MMPASSFSDLEKCAQVGEVTSKAVCIFVCKKNPESLTITQKLYFATFVQ